MSICYCSGCGDNYHPAGTVGCVKRKAGVNELARFLLERFDDGLTIARMKGDQFRIAELDAKRRIVLLIGDPGPMVFRLLAIPYADHPDYREEWKP